MDVSNFTPFVNGYPLKFNKSYNRQAPAAPVPMQLYVLANLGSTLFNICNQICLKKISKSLMCAYHSTMSTRQNYTPLVSRNFFIIRLENSNVKIGSLRVQTTIR